MNRNHTLLNNKTISAQACATKLRTDKVNLYYGSFQALRNITLDIPACAITAIIGPSGCGKSSLLRLFNRMNDLIPGARVEGNVELDGILIYDSKIDVVELRKKVGMVFQKPNPFPMSMFENVAFGPMRHGISNRAELEEIVEKVCARQPYGMRLRTSWSSQGWPYLAGSSRDYALLEYWRWSQRSS